MANIRPFRALRPLQQLVEQVATLPYDVMNTAEAKAMAEGNPNSFLHVSRAEIDLPQEVDIHSAAVYAKANENFRKLIADGVLVQEEKPCYYIYELIMDGRSQTGLVCGSSIDDYNNGIVKKHEFTRPEKELDRINHILDIYRIIYNKNLNTSQALNYIEEELPATDERDEIVTFIRESGRGIIKRFSKGSMDDE